MFAVRALLLVYTSSESGVFMQAELEKVSSLLDAAAKSFRANVEEDGCTRLSEAAAILETILATESAPATQPERPRSRVAVA